MCKVDTDAVYHFYSVQIPCLQIHLLAEMCAWQHISIHSGFCTFTDTHRAMRHLSCPMLVFRGEVR